MDECPRRMTRDEIADLIPAAAGDEGFELVVAEPWAYVTCFSLVWPARGVTIDFAIDEATIETPSYETHDRLRSGLAHTYREGVALGKANTGPPAVERASDGGGER